MVPESIQPESSSPSHNTAEKQEESGDKNRECSGDNGGGPSANFSALINAIRNEAEANRNEERREDRGKTFREYLTLLLVFVTAGAVIYQAYIFSGQLDEMKSSGEQTGLLIENNAKLAIAAGKQAEAAEKQAIAMGDYAKATRDSVVASQRAWVGPRNIKIDKPPVLNESLKLTLEYQNTGRDPATETIKDIDVFTATEQEEMSGAVTTRINDFISACKIMWKPQSANVVYPSTGLGAGYTLTKVMDGKMIDEEVVAGTKNIYASGCFVYKTFETIHRSWFCYYFKSGKVEPTSWAICETGNNAD
jgi:hypothetical protein